VRYAIKAAAGSAAQAGGRTAVRECREAYARRREATTDYSMQTIITLIFDPFTDG